MRRENRPRRNRGFMWHLLKTKANNPYGVLPAVWHRPLGGQRRKCKGCTIVLGNAFDEGQKQ
jgi:hypothetical protein